LYVQNILEQKKITQGTEGFCEQSCNHNVSLRMESKMQMQWSICGMMPMK